MRTASQGSAAQTSPEEGNSPANSAKCVGRELRFEERADDLASSASVGSETGRIVMNLGKRRWREGKVRPIPGNSPHDRLVSRVISSSLKESLRRSLLRHCFPPTATILGAQYAFLRHGGIYLVRCGSKSKPKTKPKPWGGTVPPPAGRPRAQVAERAGRITLHLIVRR